MTIWIHRDTLRRLLAERRSISVIDYIQMVTICAAIVVALAGILEALG